jgi:cyclase
MFNPRIISRLDVKGPNLVKGIHLEGLRALGRPHDFAKYYYESGADEILYMDVVASLYGRNSLNEIIEETARDIFIPITAGGGIRSLEDIRQVLRAGADKVAINTAAIQNPSLIRDAALAFGSSTIVVAIEAIRQPDGTYLAYTDNGREHTGRHAVEWAKQAAGLGAGEILVTSVDREGTGEGFDLDLTRSIARSVSVPVVAHGGAGCVEDVCKVLTDGLADAVALASVLHYDSVDKVDSLRASEAEGNFEFLRSGSRARKIRRCSISDVKASLAKTQISCRPATHDR